MLFGTVFSALLLAAWQLGGQTEERSTEEQTEPTQKAAPEIQATETKPVDATPSPVTAPETSPEEQIAQPASTDQPPEEVAKTEPEIPESTGPADTETEEKPQPETQAVQTEPAPPPIVRPAPPNDEGIAAMPSSLLPNIEWPPEPARCSPAPGIEYS